MIQVHLYEELQQMILAKSVVESLNKGKEE